MARWMNLKLEAYDGQFVKAGMDRIERAAAHIQLQMQTECIKSYENRRPVYKTGKDAGKIYTARDFDIMAKTIRVVRKDNKLNIRIYAGNYKTWWALQMEYGRGKWKGGARPFVRKAVAKSVSKIQPILESGAGQTEV